MALSRASRRLCQAAPSARCVWEGLCLGRPHHLGMWAGGLCTARFLAQGISCHRDPGSLWARHALYACWMLRVADEQVLAEGCLYASCWGVLLMCKASA